MVDVSTGSVAFLFTDIEGSTRLWQEQAEAMRRDLAHHDALLRAAIERHSGHVFKTVGDAFYAAFADARDAVQAAVEAQRELQQELPQVRVRMAVHTGEADAREGDYFGPTLNHVARLLAAGHGGQVLLSQPAAERVRSSLPGETQLRPLGVHRLRDIAVTETIYQLQPPDLPAEFPPLNTLDVAFRRGIVRATAVAAAVVVIVASLALLAWKNARSEARQRRATERLLYVSDMNRAQQAWNEGNEERAEELLEEHRPGKRGAADLRGFEWRYLWRLCQHGALYTFHGNGGPVQGVAYSPDGKTLAARNADGSVTLWDTATKKEAATLPPTRRYTGPVLGGGPCVAFSPDGKILAVNGTPADPDVKLWELASATSEASERARKVATLPGPGASLCFSPDGKLLAGYGPVGTQTWVPLAKLWDVDRALRRQGSAEVRTFRAPDGLRPASSPDGTARGGSTATREKPIWRLRLAFSPDGKTMALASGSAVELWRIAAARPVAPLGRLIVDASRYRGDARYWGWAVVFLPDGKTLVTHGLDQTIRLWDCPTRRLVATLPAPRPKERLDRSSYGMSDEPAAVLSPDGRKLATASGKAREVTLWDLDRSRRKEIAILRGHKKYMSWIAFSPDGETLATASMDETIKLWSAAPARGSAFPKLRSELLALAFAPDGKTVATGNEDGTVTLWDAASQSKVASLQGHRGSVRSVAFSPDGKLLASGGGDHTVRLWRAGAAHRPLTPLTPLNGHTDQVSCVAFSSNGRSLASGGEDGTVRLWDVARATSEASGQAREIMPPLETEGGVVMALAFSPDGKTLALGTNAQSVRLWGLASRQEVPLPLAHRSWVTAVAFSPDGKTVASGSDDHTIALWDVASRRSLGPLMKGCKGRINSLAFSPDGRTLASGSSDKSVRLWNVATGREVATLPGEQGAVTCVAFSPDGNALVAGGKEGRVRLWRAASFADADSKELPARLSNRPTRPPTASPP